MKTKRLIGHRIRIGRRLRLNQPLVTDWFHANLNRKTGCTSNCHAKLTRQPILDSSTFVCCVRVNELVCLDVVKTIRCK